VRVVINAPFPTAGAGWAGVALNQFSWNGVAATVSSTPPVTSVNPQGYYPATTPTLPTAAGNAFIVNPTVAGRPKLTSGGSGNNTPSTTFSVNPPQAAACSKDTATGQYHVYGYVVPLATNPGTLTWDANGPVLGHTDTVTVTSGTASVADTSVKATDTGLAVSGTGIPAGDFVGTVTAGSSFLISTSATAQVPATGVLPTASGTSVTIGTRTDTMTVTSGSATVADTSILAGDTGETITGTGIPANTFVGTVTAGSSFLLSSSATSQVNVNATASGSSVVIGLPAPDNDTHTLYDTGGLAFVNQNTAPVTGQVVTPGNFNWANYTATGNGGTTLALPAPGTYNVGIACVTNTFTTDRFWNTQLTFSPVATTVDPNGETWAISFTANATSTWNAQSPNNGLFGGTTGARIIGGGGTTISSPAITCNTATCFSAADVGKPIRGNGVGLGAYISSFVSCTPTTGPCTVNATVNSTATNTGVVLSIGGSSWWQPAGASGNAGSLVLAYDLGFPKTITSLTTSWLNANFCPGHGTCSGFEGINYQIYTSPDGTANNWTLCKAVTANSSFTTVDSCTAPATGAQYVEYFITSWNSTTPFSAADGYGPGFNSILIQ
jgi:hypothetical protein